MGVIIRKSTNFVSVVYFNLICNRKRISVMYTVFCCIYFTRIIHCATSGDLNQVVDLGSTWRALYPKLGCETRPLVLKAIAEFLSLVPSLRVKTEQYEVRLHFPPTSAIS